VVVEEDAMGTSGKFSGTRAGAGKVAMAVVAITLFVTSCSGGSKTASSDSASVAGTQGKAVESNRALGAPAAGGQGAGAGPQTAEASFKVDALGQTPSPQVGSFI
jgi:hypothetical protein